MDLKVIFICSPNNPTANVMDVSSITSILQNFNGIVFIDEAYIDFSDQVSFIDRIQEYPNLIVSQTLSKAWGLAGIRVGVAYMHEYFAAVFNKVKPPYNVSMPNQSAALIAISNVKTVQKQVAILNQEKEKLIAQLWALPGVKNIYPSKTTFILVEVVDADFWYQYLLKQKIIVRNRHSVIKNCLRITIGSAEENKRLVDALKKITDE
jgi:histidinol-phosphate aminotransferase